MGTADRAAAWAECTKSKEQALAAQKGVPTLSGRPFFRLKALHKPVIYPMIEKVDLDNSIGPTTFEFVEDFATHFDR